MIFTNQTELVGSILPNVYIRKITLENGGTSITRNDPHIDHAREPETIRDPRTGKLVRRYVQPNLLNRTTNGKPLRVVVDLLIKETLDDNLIGNWFGSIDFSKYIKAKIVQVTDESLSNIISDDRKILNLTTRLTKLEDSAFKKLQEMLGASETETERLIETSIVSETLNLKDDILGGLSDAPRENKNVAQDGSIIIDYPFRKSFILPNSELDYLAYFAYTYIDFEELSEDLGIRFDFTSTLEFGKISAEEVIRDKALSTTSFVYIDRNNELWTGPVQERDNFEFVGITSGEEIPLKRIRSGNSTVQDFRIFDRLERLNINTNLFFNSRVLRQLDNVNKRFAETSLTDPEGYFTKFHLSRDLDGNARFLFGFDYKRFIVDNSRFGKLFDKVSPNLDDSSLVTLSVHRKRIKGSPEIGSKAELDKEFNKFDPVDFLVNSGEKQFGSFEKSDREDHAVLKEVSIVSNQGVRFFTGIDKQIKDFTDGYFIYQVKAKVKDPSILFVKNEIEKLDVSINTLSKLLSEGSSPDNFDELANKFKDSYVQRVFSAVDMDNPYWNVAIDNFVSIYELFTDENLEDVVLQNLYYAVHPATSNVSSLSRVIDLVSNLKNTLSFLSGLNQSPKEKFSQLGLRNQTASFAINDAKNLMELEHEFKDIFNANVENETGMDYLDIPTPNDMFDGLRVISGQEFAERADRETNTYFNLDPDDLKPNIDIRIAGNHYNPGDSLDLSSWSYFSPSKISIQNSIQLKRIGNSPTPKNLDSKLTKLGTSVRSYNIQGRSQTVNSNYRGNNLRDTVAFDREATNIINLFGITVSPLGNRPQQVPPGVRIENRDDVTVDPIIEEQKDCSKGEVGTYMLTLQLFNNIKPISTLSDQIGNIFDNDQLSSGQINIENFDPNSRRGFVNRLAEDIENVRSESFFQGTPHNTTLADAMKALPNQIKSLLLSKVNPAVIKKNWFERKTDPFLTPNEEFEFKLSYLKLQTIQVFTGFYTDEDGNPLIRAPKWEPLTVNKFNNFIGKNLLCRLKSYENNLIGIKKDALTDLPIYDRYFLLRPNRLADTGETIEAQEPKILNLRRENELQFNIKTEFLSNLLVR